MNNKNIIIAGAIAIGAYLLSQGKEILSIPAAYTTRQKVAQKKIGQPITRAAYIAAAQKAAERVPERRPVLPAIPMPKKIAQKKVVRTGMALKIYGLKKAIAAAQALRLSTMAPGAVLPPLIAKVVQDRTVKAALRKAAAQKIGKIIGKKAAQKRIGQPITRTAYIAALRKAAAQKIGKIIGKKAAQKRIGQPTTRAEYMAAARKTVARKAAVHNAVARWVAARKAALQKAAAQKIRQKIAQKVAQKTTPVTPSARRKKRLRALYGSHWHDIWVQRQKW